MSNPINSDVQTATLVIPCEEYGKQAFIDVIADAIDKRNKSVQRFWDMFSEVLEDEVIAKQDQVIKAVLGKQSP